MKRILFVVFVMSLSINTLAQRTADGDTLINTTPVRSQPTGDREYSPKTLIIFYQGAKGKWRLLRAVKRYRATIIYQYCYMSGIAITIPDGKTLDESIAYFERVKGVVSVNKDHICHLD